VPGRAHRVRPSRRSAAIIRGPCLAPVWPSAPGSGQGARCGGPTSAATPNCRHRSTITAPATRAPAPPRAAAKTLQRKRRAAAAGGRGIGVLHHKARADQFLGEINHRILQKRQRYRIDQHLLALLFQHQIIARRIIQPDVILKPRTAAAFDRHAQGAGAAGDFGNLGQPGKGAVGHAGIGGIGGKLQVHRPNFHILHGLFII